MYLNAMSYNSGLDPDMKGIMEYPVPPFIKDPCANIHYYEDPYDLVH